jgi:hypothetical protein
MQVFTVFGVTKQYRKSEDKFCSSLFNTTATATATTAATATTPPTATTTLAGLCGNICSKAKCVHFPTTYTAKQLADLFSSNTGPCLKFES